MKGGFPRLETVAEAIQLGSTKLLPSFPLATPMVRSLSPGPAGAPVATPVFQATGRLHAAQADSIAVTSLARISHVSSPSCKVAVCSAEKSSLQKRFGRNIANSASHITVKVSGSSFSKKQKYLHLEFL